MQDLINKKVGHIPRLEDNVVEKTVLPALIYRVNAISFKIPDDFLQKLITDTKICMHAQRTQIRQNYFEKEEQN